MIHKTPSADPHRVRVTFELPNSIWAERVTLVGEFNDWSRTATPMRREADGCWRVTMDLIAGRDYQFRYLVDDEQWVNDYNADGYVANAYGSDNSLVHADMIEPSADGAGDEAGDAPATGRVEP